MKYNTQQMIISDKIVSQNVIMTMHFKLDPHKKVKILIYKKVGY